MDGGIIVCGLNGAGKSTLGKMLAERLGFYFIDIEDLYFPKTDPSYTYADPRTEGEVGELLYREVNRHRNFVLAAGSCEHWPEISRYFRYAVLIEVPKEIRLRRVRSRSHAKFGDRMIPGGDLYEREEAFFRQIESKDESAAEKYALSLGCHVLRVDGTRPVPENVSLITTLIKEP